MKGIDYSKSRPDLGAVAAVGYKFICRYLSYDRSKNIDRAERDLALSLGLSIVLVWETSAGRALAGYRAGQDDATEATNQARMLGITGRPIYFAVDFDASAGDQPAIDEYLRGVANVIGPDRVGVYGSYWVIKRCLDNGTAKYAWQTYAWSWNRELHYTMIDPRNHIFQYQNGIRGHGGEFDLNEARQEDFGQYPFEKGREDEDMIAIIKFDDGTTQEWIADFGAKTIWPIPGEFQKNWIQEVAKGYFGKPIPQIKGPQTLGLKAMFRNIDAEVEAGNKVQVGIAELLSRGSTIAGGLTDDDLKAIAEAVNDELARRAAS